MHDSRQHVASASQLQPVAVHVNDAIAVCARLCFHHSTEHSVVDAPFIYDIPILQWSSTIQDCLYFQAANRAFTHCF